MIYAKISPYLSRTYIGVIRKYQIKFRSEPTRFPLQFSADNNIPVQFNNTACEEVFDNFN